MMSDGQPPVGSFISQWTRDQIDIKYIEAVSKMSWFYYSGFDHFMIIFSLLVTMVSWANVANSMNIVFTNDKIETLDVPCYTQDVYRGLGTFYYDQYIFEWWLFTSTWVSFVYPLYQVYLWAGAATQGYQTRVENMFISTVVFVVFAIVFGIMSYQSFFCADFNFCRSCDCEQKFNCQPNSMWWFRLMFCLFIMMTTLIYGTVGLLGFYEIESEERVRIWSNKAKAIEYMKSKGYYIEP